MPTAERQRRAKEAADHPDTPEAEEWRQALTRDLEAAEIETTERAQPVERKK